MSLNKFILNTLANVGAPVVFENYTGSKDTYIRFFYLPQVQQSAEDDEEYTTHYVQVDVFSPGSYLDLVKNTKKLLKKAGFRKNHEHEMYETDTKLFHKILRFYIIKEEN